MLERLRALPRDSEERAVICEILVERHTALVRSCVRKAEIGGRLGISQMHVSRLLTRALDHLRARLIGESTDAV